jgi:hypothetical protein
MRSSLKLEEAIFKARVAILVDTYRITKNKVTLRR